MGYQKTFPLAFSAVFFGIIFGFTGASGGLPLYLVSAMSYIIFAGSAQFIALVLIIDGQPLAAVFIAAVIINLRHLLYGIAVHDILEDGKQKLFFSYFLTDECFLATTLVHKQAQKEDNQDLKMNYVLLGSGLTLWIGWNIATIVGYLIYSSISNLSLPENFVIAASFFGFLLETIVTFPEERKNILITSIFAMGIAFLVPSSLTLILIMIFGAIISVIFEYQRVRRQSNE